jgi:tRNA A-37 threonylcarbamoyl transferase component Bud32
LIIDSKSRLWLIDFGLSEMNATIEMKGVDLHLIYRALETVIFISTTLGRGADPYFLGNR